MGMRGGPPFGGPPTLADVLPPMFHFMLNLTPRAEDKARVGSEIGHREARDDPRRLRSGSCSSSHAAPTHLASPASRRRRDPTGPHVARVLKLSADQKKAVTALQKDVDGKAEALLNKDQKDQMKEFRRTMVARGGPPGPRPGSPPPRQGGPPGPVGPPMGPPGGFGNAVFRAYRYSKDFPGSPQKI